MKKLLVLMLVLSMFVPVAKASDLNGMYWDVEGFTFTYPLANVDASFYWKSITTKDEMFGAQTTLISYPKKPVMLNDKMIIYPNRFKLSFGAITSFKANGMPYLSLSAKLWNITNSAGEEILYAGIGYGKDFKAHQDHFIVGATHKIW